MRGLHLQYLSVVADGGAVVVLRCAHVAQVDVAPCHHVEVLVLERVLQLKGKAKGGLVHGLGLRQERFRPLPSTGLRLCCRILLPGAVPGGAFGQLAVLLLLLACGWRGCVPH